jgi:hypothetical protein
MEPIDPNRGFSEQGQSPDMPSSQKKNTTYTTQAPEASNSFSKRGNARPVVIKKGQGKSKFRTIATAAVIVTVVAIGALLLTKAKSNKASAKGDAPQIDLSDEINPTDKLSQDKAGDAPEADRESNESGPSLDIAKYAKESAERKNRQNQDQQQDFRANDLKDPHDYYDYKALLERYLRQKEMREDANTIALGKEGEYYAAFVPITMTDWSNCSPSLKERAENIKKTLKLIGEKKATTEDLVEAAKSLDSLSAKIGKRLSTNQLLVQQRENIINEINNKIAR